MVGSGDGGEAGGQGLGCGAQMWGAGGVCGGHVRQGAQGFGRRSRVYGDATSPGGGGQLGFGQVWFSANDPAREEPWGTGS